MKKIVYFDVCGTLIDRNTTFDFIVFYHRQRKHTCKWLYTAFLLSFPGKVLRKLLGFSLRPFFLASLRGELKTDMYEVAELYVQELLTSHCIYPVYSKFEAYAQSDQYQIVLLSASIDPVIASLATELGVSSFSSELDYSDGVCSGILANDLKGTKQFVFESQSRAKSSTCSTLSEYDNTAKAYAFYSDNLDDLPCAMYVENYVQVVKGSAGKEQHNVATGQPPNAQNITVLYV